VQKFSLNGAYLGQFGAFGTEIGQLAFPTSISVDGQGNLFVVDQGNNRVQMFTPQGQVLAVFGKEEAEVPALLGDMDIFLGKLDSPYGIAAGDLGEVFVTDQNNYRVAVFQSPQ
jgi:DNA-binding beta-propeller fold protein YncE